MSQVRKGLRFSKHIEARAVNRQKHFAAALLSNSPLLPQRAGWTLGDAIYLSGLLGHWLKTLPPCSEESFGDLLADLHTSKDEHK